MRNKQDFLFFFFFFFLYWIRQRRFSVKFHLLISSRVVSGNLWFYTTVNAAQRNVAVPWQACKECMALREPSISIHNHMTFIIYYNFRSVSKVSIYLTLSNSIQRKFIWAGLESSFIDKNGYLQIRFFLYLFFRNLTMLG